MSYDAKAIEIMIASPSDVIPERQIIRDSIAEWNAIHSRRQGICLMPVGWETHSAPSMDDRAQGIINEQILKNCDLLVGIFWTRVGSPTGKAISGSIEEIELHRAEGKPVMLYFSTAPVALGNVDQDQYAALSEFKRWATEQGLVSNFESRDDFRLQFSRQLAITINTSAYLKHEFPDLVAVFEKELESGSKPPVSVDSVRPAGLSDDAIELLVAAALPDNGSRNLIMFRRHLGGTSISAGNKNFGEPQNQRSIARWQAASDELFNNGLTNDINGKGEIFEVTHAGFSIADAIDK